MLLWPRAVVGLCEREDFWEPLPCGSLGLTAQQAGIFTGLGAWAHILACVRVGGCHSKGQQTGNLKQQKSYCLDSRSLMPQ